MLICQLRDFKNRCSTALKQRWPSCRGWNYGSEALTAHRPLGVSPSCPGLLGSTPGLSGQGDSSVRAHGSETRGGGSGARVANRTPRREPVVWKASPHAAPAHGGGCAQVLGVSAPSPDFLLQVRAVPRPELFLPLKLLCRSSEADARRPQATEGLSSGPPAGTQSSHHAGGSLRSPGARALALSCPGEDSWVGASWTHGCECEGRFSKSHVTDGFGTLERRWLGARSELRWHWPGVVNSGGLDAQTALSHGVGPALKNGCWVSLCVVGSGGESGWTRKSGRTSGSPAGPGTVRAQCPELPLRDPPWDEDWGCCGEWAPQEGAAGSTEADPALGAPVGGGRGRGWDHPVRGSGALGAGTSGPECCLPFCVFLPTLHFGGCGVNVIENGFSYEGLADY